MKKLFYSTFSCVVPHIGVMLDDVKRSAENGDDVYWAYCHGVLSSCWANRAGQKGACKLCHRMYKEYYNNYVPGAKMIPIRKGNVMQQKHEISIATPKDVHDFEYRGVKVGLSILSTYYGFTRDLDIKDFESFKNYCIPLMNEICNMIDFSIKLVDEIKPDEVIIFNGRHFSNRFFYDICNQKDIAFSSLEVIGGFNDPPFKRIQYKGALPHSIDLRAQYANQLWESSPETTEKKIETAENFYKRRRNGDLVADVKAYVADQQKGLLPSDFDQSKHNIAIFNSSPDEFAAIGGEWEENLLFDSQYEAIKYILNHSPQNYHYYLRIHPNLAGINHKAHMDLYLLSEFDNITIIGPTEKISTYSLMDKCDKILTFGSTMGIEATFWGKPSIMIGHSFYEKLDACYSPSSKEELLSLLMKSSLDPKPKDGSLKYAYLLLDRKFLVKPTSIDIDIHYKKVLIDFPYTNYQKIFGKKWIYQLAYLIMVRIPSRFNSKNKRLWI